MARILVADDNSNIQKMVALALQEQGVEVIGVGNGEAAVRKVPELRPDVILADVFMPVRSGYEVCEFVKNDSRFSQIPVVLLVGAFDPLDEHEAQRVRADGVLKKPFVPPEPLVNLVKALLIKSAGEKLVAVGAPSTSAASTAEAVAAKAAPKARVPEVSEEIAEELVAPRPSVKVAEDNRTVAFSSLLEAPVEEPAVLDQNDPILTAPRDVQLGEPAFWTRPPQMETQEAPVIDEEDPTEHSWGRSTALPGADEAAAVAPELPIDLDREAARVRALEFPPTEEEELTAAAAIEPVGEDFEVPQEANDVLAPVLETRGEAPVAQEFEAALAATVIEWPRVAEEELPLPEPILEAPVSAAQSPAVLDGAAPGGADLELEAPIGSEPPNVWALPDPSLASMASLAAERQALLQVTPEETQEVDPLPELPELEAAVAAAKPGPEHAVATEEPEHADDVTSSWPPPFVPSTVPADKVHVVAPAASATKWASLDEPLTLPSVAAPVTTAAIPHIAASISPAIPGEEQTKPTISVVQTPAASSVPSATPIVAAPTSADESKASAQEAAAVAISPEIIDTVVNRIVDRMQPQVLELITREILRPVVEALVRREIEKK